MDKHIDLLGMLFSLCGALGLLVSVALLVLSLGAAAMSTDGRAVAAGVIAVLFAAVGTAALVWAASCLWTGRAVRRRDPRGRLAALVLGGLNLLVLPLGTALGAYSLWVLLHHDARRRFEREPEHPEFA